MLTLLLTLALMIILAAAIVPSITFDIKRDREEEMIHRGVQYSRAIRAYYKKFQRYPTKIEDLESSNNQRFLRKRYKDPITGKDFKLLHFGEVQLTLSMGAGGGGITGASTIGANGSFTGGPQALAANANTLGQSQGQQANQATGTDPSQASGDSTGTNGTGPGNNGGTFGSSSGNSSGTGQVFGGGPIVGVASTSKDSTIREFNHKKKYNQWQFIYDPAMDRGGIITTPNQPQLQGMGQQGMTNINGQSGTSGFGNAPGGLQNNPMQPQNGGFGTPSPNPPSNPPQQQQQ